MNSKILEQKEIQLRERRFLVYLKEVPTKIAVGGAVEKTAIRAFVKEI